MNNKKRYAGIDSFRYIAALLVIAIHTSPLSSYSEMGDFVLTRIIGRAAVPFFFMTSGFFLIKEYSYNEEKLRAFVKKTSVIYGLSIAAYIPLNLYNGYFTMENLFPNIMKDIFFDGTLYHLWYLPASIIGAVIAWYLVKGLGFKKAFMAAMVLYVIGLFGDSYYGVSEKLPFLKSIYGHLFQIFDYTRNGILFAPVFFVLGGIIARNPGQGSWKKSLVKCMGSFLLMLGEGLLLHQSGYQRHDSMYVMLIPAMYYLFSFLCSFTGGKSLPLRTAPLIIYMIHPMVIVMVRMTAKMMSLQSVFIENSVIHYATVSVCSISFSLFLALFIQKVRNKGSIQDKKSKSRAWIEINLSSLENNAKELQSKMPENCNLMAVIKANAYGHGAFAVSTYLEKSGVKSFAVATIDEGIELRKYGIRSEILILGYTSPLRAKELYKYRLTQTLIDHHYARLLNHQGYKVSAHIKIDTGMHRLGFDVSDHEHVIDAFKMKQIKVTGIYTHLCASDSLSSEDVTFTAMQIRRFYQLVDIIENSGYKCPKIHIQSSYGLLNYPELKCDFVRAGISLYGVLSSAKDQIKTQLNLHPVLSLKSKVVLLRKVTIGESVGYHRTFVASKDSTIAVIPIGYADGLPRNLSSESRHVLMNGNLAPIVGRICMDQLMVDVTGIEGVKVGDIVTFIGEDHGKALLAPAIADNEGSISNELFSRIGTRLEVITVE
ncbi:serine racemase VanT catalytic subunit [Lacrimispora aerotolerans]|uniref:serine racemase VanT catalytic subunit n=1 Tax=Lacrimispora aerotolerans TaxID=36832 RepID=UPI00047A4ED3|nr:serine racemase VanT catalytic subunit [Lacrimispora aerotolerans]